MDTVFTVEESNLVGVFLEEGTVTGNREKVMEGIKKRSFSWNNVKSCETANRLMGRTLGAVRKIEIGCPAHYALRCMRFDG